VDGIQEAKAMNLLRAIAPISAILCVTGLTTVGQQDNAPPQTDPKAQIERCKAAMPSILKNYNNAKYAVFLARNSGGGPQAGNHVDTAQAALDAMEQPLKVCSEAMQSVQDEQPPGNQK
jgi:hypothetical protein